MNTCCNINGSVANGRKILFILFVMFDLDKDWELTLETNLMWEHKWEYQNANDEEMLLDEETMAS